MGNERIVRANGVELCVETFGAAGDPAVLLIGGMTSSMDWWREEFCATLAEHGRFVIRYDFRDTGRSVSYPPGKPEYSFSDLIGDALGILDVLGVGRAHLVGISMGGGLAQVIGIEHADRVASLTLISTSSGPAADLPPVAPRLAEFFANPPAEPDWSDRAAVIDYIVAQDRVYGGSLPRDEVELRELAGRVFDRTVAIESSMKNHALLVSDGRGEPLRPRLGRITAPTLVIHGTEDPLFPLGHGEALAAEIPGARLLPLDGVGHEVPPRPVWPEVIKALVAHTA